MLWWTKRNMKFWTGIEYMRRQFDNENWSATRCKMTCPMATLYLSLPIQCYESSKNKCLTRSPIFARCLVGPRKHLLELACHTCGTVVSVIVYPAGEMVLSVNMPYDAWPVTITISTKLSRCEKLHTGEKNFLVVVARSAERIICLQPT